MEHAGQPGNAGCYGEWSDPFWLYRLVRQHDEYAPGRLLTKRNGDCTGSGVLLCPLPVCQPVCAHRNHAAVILAVGKGIPGVPMEQLCILLVLSIGIMGCLTPYATGPGVIIYGCGYVKSKDYWRLGAIFGVIYISMLLLVGWPILAMWN